ncbi:uncharacterized protein LOC113562823 [Ooceraea biroi]|uniref:uncharacterized protein LOC113562823 n=1 Tax=Ooceraea biroi TaxID=2015173 RepID=UPI000F074405|nr:uncharacterized protein LOC113562823 [Ooceraea biroi]
MEWNEETTLRFIDIYKENDLLWNPKNQKYYNKIMRNDAWLDISKQMNLTPEECKRKMFSLLAALRREKSQIKKSQGTDEIYNSSWFAFQSLQFMLDKDVPTNTLNTVNKIIFTAPENVERVQDNVSSQSENNEEGMTNILQPIENKTPLRKRKNMNMI